MIKYKELDEVIYKDEGGIEYTTYVTQATDEEGMTGIEHENLTVHSNKLHINSEPGFSSVFSKETMQVLDVVEAINEMRKLLISHQFIVSLDKMHNTYIKFLSDKDFIIDTIPDEYGKFDVEWLNHHIYLRFDHSLLSGMYITRHTVYKNRLYIELLSKDDTVTNYVMHRAA